MKEHPLVTVIEEEITEIPEGITVIATGPLTSEPLSKAIQAFNGSEGFYFYDAAAPIIDKSTIDMDKVYLKSRYDKGEAAYLELSDERRRILCLREALVNAEVAPLKEFEKREILKAVCQLK